VKPGSEIAGRYKLVSLIGEGGMGSVWRAEHLTLHSHVAIKLINPGAASLAPQARERFMREARSAASLSSPHVVHITDFGVDDDVPFIAMELLEGETLEERLERVRPLAPGETLRLLHHVARAIGKAHEAGIVHRDLKPANVFIVKNEDAELAKVLDFGVAKDTQRGDDAASTALTQSGAVVGTPCYMSPEQATGERDIDFRSDLWSLGVIAFECITGERPFSGETLGSLVLQICSKPLPVPSEIASVPEGFDAWFAKAVARDPDDRFDSAREMIKALRAVLGPAAGRLSGSLDEWRPDATGPSEDDRRHAASKAVVGGSMSSTGQLAATELGARSVREPSTPGKRMFGAGALLLGIGAAAYAYYSVGRPEAAAGGAPGEASSLSDTSPLAVPAPASSEQPPVTARPESTRPDAAAVEDSGLQQPSPSATVAGPARKPAAPVHAAAARPPVAKGGTTPAAKSSAATPPRNIGF